MLPSSLISSLMEMGVWQWNFTKETIPVPAENREWVVPLARVSMTVKRLDELTIPPPRQSRITSHHALQAASGVGCLLVLQIVVRTL